MIIHIIDPGIPSARKSSRKISSASVHSKVWEDEGLHMFSYIIIYNNSIFHGEDALALLMHWLGHLMTLFFQSFLDEQVTCSSRKPEFDCQQGHHMSDWSFPRVSVGFQENRQTGKWRFGLLDIAGFGCRLSWLVPQTTSWPLLNASTHFCKPLLNASTHFCKHIYSWV